MLFIVFVIQLCVATACASTGASVERDLLSYATVLLDSTGPAASMVSGDLFLKIHNMKTLICGISLAHLDLNLKTEFPIDINYIYIT